MSTLTESTILWVNSHNSNRPALLAEAMQLSANPQHLAVQQSQPLGSRVHSVLLVNNKADSGLPVNNKAHLGLPVNSKAHSEGHRPSAHQHPSHRRSGRHLLLAAALQIQRLANRLLVAPQHSDQRRILGRQQVQHQGLVSHLNPVPLDNLAVEASGQSQLLANQRAVLRLGNPRNPAE